MSECVSPWKRNKAACTYMLTSFSEKWHFKRLSASFLCCYPLTSLKQFSFSCRCTPVIISSNQVRELVRSSPASDKSILNAQ